MERAPAIKFGHNMQISDPKNHKSPEMMSACVAFRFALANGASYSTVQYMLVFVVCWNHGKTSTYHVPLSRDENNQSFLN